MLGHQRHQPRPPTSRHRRDRLTVEPDLARETDDPGHRLEEAAFAGPIRAHQGQPFTFADRERDTGDGLVPVESDSQIRDRDHNDLRLVRSTATKNGAPHRAVITPIGSSAGASTVRAARSAAIRNAAPSKAASGNTARYEEPTTNRIACGTITPTKLMRPLTDTAAAVPRVAAHTTQKRTEATWMPSPAASSSPTARASSSRRWRRITTRLTTT